MDRYPMGGMANIDVLPGRGGYVYADKQLVVSRTTSPAPSRSDLFTTNTSAISKMPAFAIWTASPMPGARTTMAVSVAVMAYDIQPK